MDRAVRGRFDMGWDEYRKVVFDRQKKLGVIPAGRRADAASARDPALGFARCGQEGAARLMEVFAGFMAQVDHEVGRVIDAFRETGQLDNTLIVFIAGDNGASLEGSLTGTDNLMEQVNGIQSPASEVVKHLDASAARSRTRTIRSAGPGPATRRSSGASASARIWAARAIRW